METTANNSHENNENYSSENNHLLALGGSDYEIKDGEPDIKGWDVKNELGQKLGEVDELLFDPESRKVRYIVLDLSSNELGIDLDKMVLVPIGIAEIFDSSTEPSNNDGLNTENEARISEGRTVISPEDDPEELYHSGEAPYDPAFDNDVVIIPANLEQLSALPSFVKGEVLSPESEFATRRVFEGRDVIDATGYNRNEFYEHNHFDEKGYFDRGATATQFLPGDHQDPENQKN